MIDYKTAKEIVLGHIRSHGREEVALSSALGRTMAGAVLADRNYPPFNRSTMDGYALRKEDLENGTRHFGVIGTIYAGGAAVRDLGPGEAYRIMTGAPVPAGADLVVRREEIDETAAENAGTGPLEGLIRIREIPAGGWKSFQNIARCGEDLKSGQPVLGKGVVCTPSVIGLLASLGHGTVLVERHPRVAIITTGDEIVEIGAPPGESGIRNSNRWLLESLFRSRGVGITRIGHARDEISELRRQLGEIMDFDLIVLSGGVSAGDADLTPEALEKAGAKKLFHKMAIKPGKPTWCGVTPEKGMIFALPGNPFSCLVNFALLIKPWLQGCMGQEMDEPIGLPLGFAKKKMTPLDEFFPVRLRGMPGRLEAISMNGSGDVRLGFAAGMLALHPAETGDLPADTQVRCYSLV